jgi:hypothetical protein
MPPTHPSASRHTNHRLIPVTSSAHRDTTDPHKHFIRIRWVSGDLAQIRLQKKSRRLVFAPCLKRAAQHVALRAKQTLGT